MFPLNTLLRRTLKDGRLLVTGCDGRTVEFGQTKAPVDAAVTLREPGVAWRIARNPELNIGEAYVDGSLTIDQGSVLGLTGVLLRNLNGCSSTLADRVAGRIKDWMTLPAVYNIISRARRNARHHYDQPAELFSLFLDTDRQYSCAYFRDGTGDIEAAQLAKKQHIAAKLRIEPGQHILDIGSGWGGLAFYLASEYPVRVTGLTLSEEQFRTATARAREMGLEERVTFKLADYRQEEGLYDRVVSVGMFEHVGKPHFGTFFRKIASLLSSEGVALIHTIGFRTPPGPINPWLRRHIFPGAYLPSLSQLVPIFETQALWLTDFENLRMHYARTLAAWNARFQTNRAHAARLFGERFCRMWEFYLQCCEAGFRWGGLTVFQLQLAKAIDALPITRDYITAEEARLAAGGAGAALFGGGGVHAPFDGDGRPI
jgi:cyclopropane-fatty-acyl-phospholipid synthase